MSSRLEVMKNFQKSLILVFEINVQSLVLHIFVTALFFHFWTTVILWLVMKKSKKNLCMSRRDVETTWRNLNCRGGHRQDLPKPWHQFSVINMIFLLPRKFPLGNKRSTRHGVLESMITYYEMNEKC